MGGFRTLADLRILLVEDNPGDADLVRALRSAIERKRDRTVRSA